MLTQAPITEREPFRSLTHPDAAFIVVNSWIRAAILGWVLGASQRICVVCKAKPASESGQVLINAQTGEVEFQNWPTEQ
jgi:hypothetical protein